LVEEVDPPIQIPVLLRGVTRADAKKLEKMAITLLGLGPLFLGPQVNKVTGLLRRPQSPFL